MGNAYLSKLVLALIDEEGYLSEKPKPLMVSFVKWLRANSKPPLRSAAA